MSLNTPSDSIDVSAQNDFTKKIKMEGLFVASLIPYFTDIASASKELFNSTGSILDISSFDAQLESILKNNYESVFNNFQTPITDKLSTLVTLNENYEETLDKLNNSFFDNMPRSQMTYIKQTTQSNLYYAYALAMANLTQDSDSSAAPVATSQQRNQVSSDASQNFNNLSTTHSSLIATTETQSSSETSKQYAIKAGINTVTAITLTTKVWYTNLDGRERQSHHDAAGQQQPFIYPFMVQGEKLNYPGDTSLGATVSNIARCRCSCQYKIGQSVVDALA